MLHGLAQDQPTESCDLAPRHRKLGHEPEFATTAVQRARYNEEGGAGRLSREREGGTRLDGDGLRLTEDSLELRGGHTLKRRLK